MFLPRWMFTPHVENGSGVVPILPARRTLYALTGWMAVRRARRMGPRSAGVQSPVEKSLLVLLASVAPGERPFRHSSQPPARPAPTLLVLPESVVTRMLRATSRFLPRPAAPRASAGPPRARAARKRVARPAAWQAGSLPAPAQQASKTATAATAQA